MRSFPVSETNSYGVFPDHSKILEVINCCHRIWSFHSIIGKGILPADGHYRYRNTLSHSIQNIVNKMNSPVSNKAACIIPIPPESEMETVFIEWALWSRSKPHIIIYSDRKSTRLNSSHANISYAV